MIVEKRRFPSPSQHVRLYTVCYLSNGLRVKGLLAEPAEPGQYDGFLYLRGGIKSVGMVRPGRIIQFASQGFVVFAPFYRGNQGGEGNEDFAGEDREDAFSAFRLLQQHPNVKKDRIHIFGFSRGGIMGMLTAIEMGRHAASFVYRRRQRYDPYIRGAAGFAANDERVIGGTPKKVPEEYQWRTPFDQVNKIQAPCC
ncbi:prolyl oligopeptidase family serine peptidase [Bacillus stercoris]|nr:prolyl oligopeptidase family serine peptidase [Bacillus stercoris]